MGMARQLFQRVAGFSWRDGLRGFSPLSHIRFDFSIVLKCTMAPMSSQEPIPMEGKPYRAFIRHTITE